MEIKTKSIFNPNLFLKNLPTSRNTSTKIFSVLLEELLDGHVLLRVLLHNLGDRHLEVLLGDVDAALSQGVHAGLSANALDLKFTQRFINLYSIFYILL